MIVNRENIGRIFALQIILLHCVWKVNTQAADACGANNRSDGGMAIRVEREETRGADVMRETKEEKKEFYRKLFALVLPLALQNLMTALVSASDALMLGMLDQSSLSSVSLATQVQFVLNLFYAALTIGTTVLAAQYWGKGDREAVERVLAIVLKSSMVISLVFFLAAFFCPHLLMRIFTNDPELIQLGIPYLRIVSWSYLFMGISQIYLCIMKNSGRTMRSTVYGSSAVVLNLLLNTLLIFGFLGFPRMEIAGAALATTIARAVELGRGALERAREYGGRLCRISVAAGAVSGVILLACSPLVQLLAASLSEQAHEYLRVMLLICAYYLIGKAVNSTVVAGIFCAGGDTKFGLLCDAVTMWVIIVPIGMLAAFVWKLPVLAVYFLLNMDEFVKLPAVYRHYKKYRWVRNLTKESQGQ